MGSTERRASWANKGIESEIRKDDWEDLDFGLHASSKWFRNVFTSFITEIAGDYRQQQHSNTHFLLLVPTNSNRGRPRGKRP